MDLLSVEDLRSLESSLIHGWLDAMDQRHKAVDASDYVSARRWALERDRRHALLKRVQALRAQHDPLAAPVAS